MKPLTILIVAVTLSSIPLHAQPARHSFGLGLQKDLFVVPLNSDQLSVETMKVKANTTLRQRLTIGIDYERDRFFHTQNKVYNGVGLLTLDFGYQFHTDTTHRFILEPVVSFSNGLQDFGKLRDYSISIGINEVIFNMFQIGSGIRFTQMGSFDQSNKAKCITWYWDFGYRLMLNSPSSRHRR